VSCILSPRDEHEKTVGIVRIEEEIVVLVLLGSPIVRATAREPFQQLLAASIVQLGQISGSRHRRLLSNAFRTFCGSNRISVAPQTS
jgi:hypothetical protein